MSNSLLEEIKKYQSRERMFNVLSVAALIASPVIPSVMMKGGQHSLLALGFAVVFVGVSLWAQRKRVQLRAQIHQCFESLGVGFCLEKKISRGSLRKFVIVDKNTIHYSLRCMNTGENVLVSKSRLREDFDVAT